MGSIVEALMKHVSNLRRNPNVDSRSQADHPERFPSDELSIVKGTKQKLKSPSTAVPKGGSGIIK